MTVRNKRITIYLLYCVVVIALILIVSLIFRPHHTPTVTIRTTHSAPAKNPAGQAAGKGGNTHIASSSPTKSSTATASGSSAKAATSLNNTGPGNVFGLFALVSVLGAWFYRRKLIRSVIR